MIKRVSAALAIVALLAFASRGQESKPQSLKVMPSKYDPARDADKDIRDAVGEARRSGKRVLLDVGGEWCVWCHRMDSFIEENSDLGKLLAKSYVVVKINVDPTNKNEAVLSRYPEIPGYPHLFVLDMNGKLLHSQDTGKLEEGKSYDLNRFSVPGEVGTLTLSVAHVFKFGPWIGPLSHDTKTSPNVVSLRQEFPRESA